MIKTIVIEDETNARKGLIKMLGFLNSNINIVGETGYVSEALELIKTKKPQLVLLDIELEDGTSFDILNAIDTISFKIIFTTAYNNYAIKAFKYSAIDYLLKPISPIELKEAIERTISDIETQNQYQELLEMMSNNGKEDIKKIVIKTSDQRFVIAIDTLIRLEADAAYTIFITETQKITISKNLKYYQDLLDNTFIRCHQSHLVNSNHIKSLYSKGLLLSNNETIPVSTRKRAEILLHINSL
ncbi:LytTR family DNA-binding domain-containing protein [uncultured Polaribacter sp.]|uniref:LytR/AlgR family response regulator transcription factor n=1 Tax=uncultured Polaribacter sp. TaxID=174711 RepID=UPI00260CA5E6|nr:LytTR family DNA-binding domain-containing protein [uncultured Polaribacter sp.]